MDEECIIGCLPIRLEKGHCIELEKLIAELPQIVLNCYNGENDVFFFFFNLHK